jgi:hypothetical protein
MVAATLVASSDVVTRTSMVARASSATTLGRVPPLIMPMLSDTTGAISRTRNKSTIWAAIS